MIRAEDSGWSVWDGKGHYYGTRETQREALELERAVIDASLRGGNVETEA